MWGFFVVCNTKSPFFIGWEHTWYTKKEKSFELLFLCGATRKHYQACNLLCASVIDV